MIRRSITGRTLWRSEVISNPQRGECSLDTRLVGTDVLPQKDLRMLFAMYECYLQAPMHSHCGILQRNDATLLVRHVDHCMTYRGRGAYVIVERGGDGDGVETRIALRWGLRLKRDGIEMAMGWD